MPIINSNTLFHFTRNIKSINGIIRNGVRLSYCYEECTKDSGFAIPMICFCDIPLLRTLEHRRKYGNYMVGFDKEYLIQSNLLFLNPVHYLNSLFLRNIGDDFFATQLDLINHSFYNELNLYIKNKGYEPLLEKYGLEKLMLADEDLNYKKDQISMAVNKFRYSMAFSKLYTSNTKGKKVINYDEREWRYISNLYSEDESFAPWVPKISEKEFNDSRKDLNSRLWNNSKAYMCINSNEICNAVKFIVVKNDRQIPSMIKFIRTSKKIFGTENLSSERRGLLISRITSFELIEKNF